MSSARRNDLMLAIVAIVVIVVDQVTKHWIVGYFAGNPARQPISVISGYLDIEFLKNTGAAFSSFDGQPWLLTLAILVALLVVGFLYWRTRNTGSFLLKLAFGLVVGGAIGNLIDRFTRAYVVDFIHFQIPGAPGHAPIFDWPVFNVADSAISVGVVLLVCALWFTGNSAAEPETSATMEATPNSTALGSRAATDDVSSVGSHQQS